MADLRISRWTVTPGAFDGTEPTARPEFFANVFEALSWIYED